MAAPPEPRANEGLWRLLTWSIVSLLVLTAAHDGDHLLNQATLGGLGLVFFLLVPVQYGAFGLTIWLLGRRDPRAPRLAALVAAIVMVGFVAAHVLPWGLAPYADYDVSALSWALVVASPAVAAGCLAIAVALIRAETTDARLARA